MKFIQDNPDYNYHTDDAAKIYFRRSALQAPTHLLCTGIGYELSADSLGTFSMELAPFEFVGAGIFGAARPCDTLSSTKWTGDSHKYGVYKHSNYLLIMESNGSGEFGYLERHSDNVRLFEHLCATLRVEQIWDICHLIAETQKQAYRKGRHELETLFLQNRLKRRKRNSRYCLEIVPEVPANAIDSYRHRRSHSKQR